MTTEEAFELLELLKRKKPNLNLVGKTDAYNYGLPKNHQLTREEENKIVEWLEE